MFGFRMHEGLIDGLKASMSICRNVIRLCSVIRLLLMFINGVVRELKVKEVNVEVLLMNFVN